MPPGCLLLLHLFKSSSCFSRSISKLFVVNYSASFGPSRPMFPRSEIVHRIHCRCFDCVAEFSSNPDCRSHRPSYFRTPVIVVIRVGSRSRLGRTKPFPVPKQLLLLGHLDVERECSRRVPTSSAGGDAATCCEFGCLRVSAVDVTSSSTFVVGLTCTSRSTRMFAESCGHIRVRYLRLHSDLVNEGFQRIDFKLKWKIMRC